MSIFDHISIPVSDFERSRTFYQAALAPLGVEQRFVASERFVAGFGKDKVAFFIAGDRVGATTVHMAFAAESREQVDAFYVAALAAGGRDNGAPGLRPKYHAGYYAAFVIDPHGNNIEAVFHEPS
ncbi:VOC family protein [Sphingopyxis sp.]|uniref:VOC family protein n=1 Tax=Sphingopyxis sp. TaxID=1908224 RepID=UPI0025DE2484|nr:VOC family protein [Sphingopyxis sp.]